MKIHSWLPQANLFTSQRPAQAEGLVTESALQHRGQRPPSFPMLTAPQAPQQTQGRAVLRSTLLPPPLSL